MTLYYVVRADLPWDRRCVQLIHAREAWIEYEKDPLRAPNHGFDGTSGTCTAVVYKVVDLFVLEGLSKRLLGDGRRVVGFHEPDLRGELTALCTPDGPLALALL